jgi:glycosyltransferase involved in cell wall biosynthesis
MCKAAQEALPVAFVSSHAEAGGAELFLESLVLNMRPDWISSVVLLAEGPLAGRLGVLGDRVRIIPAGRRAGVAAGAWKLRKHLLAKRPRVVHANGVKAALLATVATRGSGIPIVWYKTDFSRDGRLTTWIGRQCRLVVGTSHAVTTGLPDDLLGRVRVAYPGLTAQPVDRREAAKYLRGLIGAGRGDPLVAHVGRLHPGKGQLELVEIAPVLLERRPDLRVVLIGGEDPRALAYAEALRGRIDQLGLSERVVLLGHRTDAIRLMAGSDLLVISSVPDEASGWREGFGIVGAEAMSVGTPVVAYAEAALPETLGDCGYLAPAGDRAALSEGILRVLDDRRLYETLARRGQSRARRYSLTATLEAMERHYAEAAS